MKHTLSILLTLGSMTLSLGSMAQKTASQGIDEYRAMLQDGNPADLFEAKGEGLWTQKEVPKMLHLKNVTSAKDQVSTKVSLSNYQNILQTLGAYKTWNPGC